MRPSAASPPRRGRRQSAAVRATRRGLEQPPTAAIAEGCSAGTAVLAVGQ